MEQYFIKIDPKLDVVSCGNFNTSSDNTKFIYHQKDAKSEYFSSDYALSWINTEVEKLDNSKSKILFFVHGFWASLSLPLNRTTQVFENKYFKNTEDDIAAIVHIVWDANGLYYKNSIESLKKSKHSLNTLLNGLHLKMTQKISLMCHSMGNRFLYETLKYKKIETHFEELLMVAPDLHATHFESSFQLFSNIADKVFVLYHTKDKTLKLSKVINRIERLGRIKLKLESSNISFEDLTYINDIDSVIDKVMRHNYFIYSDTVRIVIEKLLKK